MSQYIRRSKNNGVSTPMLLCANTNKQLFFKAIIP